MERAEQAAAVHSEFQVFAKPGGAICNLACSYCHYLQKEHLYPDTQSFRMSDELLEQYIVQHIEASPGEVIRFSWHGGEPTILGADYFKKIIFLVLCELVASGIKLPDPQQFGLA